MIKNSERRKLSSLAKATEREKRRYDRFAGAYDFMERHGALRLGEWRALLWSKVEDSNILEVGVGTGANLFYYPRGARVTAIDLSPGMLDRARKKATLRRIDATLKEGDVQSLSFSDNSFDTVVGSLLFCSVPDPVLGLTEVRRVCKPGGKVVLLEHVLPSGPFLAFFMKMFNPFMLWLFGDNINRETVENVAKSGLLIEKVTDLGSIWRLIEARKP